MHSIRRYLLTTLLLSACLVAALVTALSYQRASHEVAELFDAELAQMARVLRSLLDQQLQSTHLTNLQYTLRYQPFVERRPYAEQSGDDDEANLWGHKYEKKLAFHIWNADGEELISSQTVTESLGFSKTPGFAFQSLGDSPWRTFTLQDEEHRLWIKVGQRMDVRQELINEIVLTHSLPSVLLMPLMGLLIWLIIGRGLKPLNRLSDQIQQREANNLQAIDTAALPREILPVVDATNSLMNKLQAALAREKEFTADAAHELRTPLAAIKIHAQNLQQATEDPLYARTLESILEGIDRMTHVVEQLLTLSRLEHQPLQSHEARLLAPLIRDICAEQSPLIQQKNQQLSVNIDEQTAVKGDRMALTVLLRNLLSNAIRYTHEGGELRIELEPGDAKRGPRLSVCDNGPGIADSDKQRVLQRFFRGQQNQVSGTGLGLAIVQEICQQHDAELKLADNKPDPSQFNGHAAAPGKGLCATVCFPVS